MSQLVEVVPLSKWLGISAEWLKTEAEAGRIPCLNADGVLLFDVDAVRRTLAKRAVQIKPRRGGVST